MHNRKSYNSEIFDYIIVGGGVAGVFTAEVLSRSLKKVKKSLQNPVANNMDGHNFDCYTLLDPSVAEACLKNVNLFLNDYRLPENNLTSIDSQLISEDTSNRENWYSAQPIYLYFTEPDYISLKLSDFPKKEKRNKLYGFFENIRQSDNVRKTENYTNMM